MPPEGISDLASPRARDVLAAASHDNARDVRFNLDPIGISLAEEKRLDREKIVARGSLTS